MALENYQQKINCKLCVVHTVCVFYKEIVCDSYVRTLYEVHIRIRIATGDGGDIR